MNLDSQIIAMLIPGLLAVIIVIVFYFRMKINTMQLSNSHLKDAIVSSENALFEEKNKCTELSQKLTKLERFNVQLETEYKNIQERLHEELNNQEKQIQQFENIANRVLRIQSANFSEEQTKGMKEILNPLSEKIRQFEFKVESTNKESIERHSSLKEQILYLSEQSKRVSNDANNLTKALKGDYKKQGNWGELILNSILEKSGLEKDREYFTQVSERDEKGLIQRPDVVIHLPDNKKIILDSKASLVAYDAMIAADSEEEAKKHQKIHAMAIRRHIDGLTQKNYHDLYALESPDFVIMFIPIDTAFSAALNHDPQLFEYAFSQNIIIVSASTLLATLKTVETLWRNDKQNRFALEIAEEAGKMYDKFVSFLEDMEKMGQQISTVQKTYDSSMNKLSTGNGNIIKRAEKVKSLGAKANKSIGQVL